MKNLKTLIVAVVLFVGATSMTQAQKVGHINVALLMNEMPEMKAAQAELEKLQKTYMADLQNSAKELQNKGTQYRSEAPSKTDEENKKRMEEVQTLQANIQAAEQEAAKQLQQKQRDLMAPISKKAEEAIKKVADAKGLDYVLDASPGGIVIVAKGVDILPDVKKELGF